LLCFFACIFIDISIYFKTLYVFDEISDNDSFCRYHNVSKEFITMAITKFSIPLASQITYQHVVELVMLETTIYVRIPIFFFKDGQV
jgi:hypothetical protein